MCGIIGTVSLDSNSPDLTTVAQLTQFLGHRGPDDSGTATLGNACFGHTRLSIIGVDNPASCQPTKSSELLLTFNGEIYNYRELLSALKSKGISLSNSSDTEVLFHCLRTWDLPKVLEMIDGMFAFAAFNLQKNKLYLARDPLGEKPLFWTIDKHSLWFSSETRPLLNRPGNSSSPNVSTIADYFFTGTINGVKTFFEDINEIEPGTFLTIGANDLQPPRIRRYWSVTAEASNHHTSRGSIVSELSDRLKQSVQSRLLSDVPVGLMLSGGIDSATIAETILSQNPHQDLNLFFANNISDGFSEMNNVKSTIKKLRIRYPKSNIIFHQSTASFKEYIEQLYSLSKHYDQPVTFPISPQLSQLSKLAQHHGFKVLLSGEGADEIFYGYERFTRTHKQVLNTNQKKTSLLNILYFGGGIKMVESVNKLIAGIASDHINTEPWQWLEQHSHTYSLPTFQMLFSQRYRLQTLLQRQDRAGMLNGIEIRVPFLRPSFVKWVNSLDEKAKIPNPANDQKYLLKVLMQNRLSEQVLNTNKQGSPSEISKWLQSNLGLNLCRELINDSDSFSKQYLHKEHANYILDQQVRGDQRYSTLTWLLFSLEMWHLAQHDKSFSMPRI